MGQGFKEVASLRGDEKKFAENFSKIDWSGASKEKEKNFQVNKDKNERCSSNPFCQNLEKIRGVYCCTLTNEVVDNGDEEDNSDYIFMRTKSCLSNDQ